MEDRDERVALMCVVGDAESEDLEEEPDATDSRALAAAALRGGIVAPLYMYAHQSSSLYAREPS